MGSLRLLNLAHGGFVCRYGFGGNVCEAEGCAFNNDVEEGLAVGRRSGTDYGVETTNSIHGVQASGVVE